jgi:hypothetical protein
VGWFGGNQDEEVHDLAASQANNPFGGWETKIDWVQGEDGLPHAGSATSEREDRWRLW